MVAALSMLLVMLAVGGLLNPSRAQFACFYASAVLAWTASWSWGVALAVVLLLCCCPVPCQRRCC